ncbi:MAG: 30S ribosomal protein S6e (modular protein) [Nitrosopumilales archaeon]|nr:MAG: 30S ribosomal protein S6e (modular protein) [Nitrosopumilales archaeon]
MTNFKLTISDKKGKSLTKELKDNEANPLLGLQIGKEADAAIVGLSGKMKITGGSDKSGVPMRSDIHGSARKYVLLTKGVGLQDAEKGQRVRKLTRGNTISEEIYQINCRFDGIIPAEKPAEEKTDPPKDEKKKAKTDPPKDEKKKAKTDPPKDEKKKAKTDPPKKTEKQEKKE